MTAAHPRLGLLVLLLIVAPPPPLHAQTTLSGEAIHITRATGPITVDGVLDDAGWQGATRVEKWYETAPGDNTEPPFRNVGLVTFDDRFFYAAFEFDDPNPGAIRSPYADHDRISGNYTDYGGVILDTRNDGHSAVLLLASASGIQYDAVTDDDGSGEDSSPDFFWDSKAKITPRGWTLELRVPFSSLRYRSLDPQKWGIFLYRNYPRDFRYTFFSAQLPRGGNCFICRANSLVGLEKLPSGGHVIAAPFLTASQVAQPRDGLGTPLVNGSIDPKVGLDVKWTPTADNAVDFTVRPDFSQVEADTAQISANERFALSFPEKRPFFLEGVELFSTPFRAVYTRTVTAPRWGLRSTGKNHGIGYTVLFADDEGGGRAIVPGPTGSRLAEQEFGATVLVARAKRSFGRNFVSVLATDREARDGNGYNRVIGPDFFWRPTPSDNVSGQWLFSQSRVPNRPDDDESWLGQSLKGSAAIVNWNRNTRHLDVYGSYRDLDNEFRADNGFIPQVGYRQVAGGGGWTVRPRNMFARVRVFTNDEHQYGEGGDLIARNTNVGIGLDTKLNGFVQGRYHVDRVLSGATLFDRRRAAFVLGFSPTRAIARIALEGSAGDEIDFDNSRKGSGVTLNASATLNPTDHLELALLQNQRWLNLDLPLARGRLFTARVSRVRGTYTFTARSFLRVIGQYVSTDRDRSLYLSDVAGRSGTFSGSALLAYKINWQSVVFFGYGDTRELTGDRELEPSDRQFFVKMSYAFQR
jgi:hypothetical protein